MSLVLPKFTKCTKYIIYYFSTIRGYVIGYRSQVKGQLQGHGLMGHVIYRIKQQRRFSSFLFSIARREALTKTSKIFSFFKAEHSTKSDADISFFTLAPSSVLNYIHLVQSSLVYTYDTGLSAVLRRSDLVPTSIRGQFFGT